MAKSSSSSKKHHHHRTEVQVSKSPAEFFAENQAIAGFDNMGKSLYTTLRELIENSLDACESIQVLPDIAVHIEEMTQHQFNVARGLVSSSHGGPLSERKDLGLYSKKTKSTSSFSKTKSNPPSETASETNSVAADAQDETKTTAGSSSSNLNAPPPATSSTSTDKKKKRASLSEGYFRIRVRDNGCGMAHEAIPNLLGRVLSGSKYGVRQTRGKFGLGAKMALIWSKKSTNCPIHITTAHSTITTTTTSTTTTTTHTRKPAPIISTCVLDIDIYKNCPRVMEHTSRPNVDGAWVGTELELLIAGNWTTYKARIVQYLQQLAIITPYAKLELRYTNRSDEKRNMTIRYDRRSEKMPPPAREVKHHPSSVNNLLISQLLERTRTKTFVKFLCTDLASVSPALAKRLTAELGHGFEEDMAPSEVTDKQVTRLVQLLQSVELFKAPDGSCLSPLGEYNLNLGIRKVLEPDVVATARDKPSAYEGHPFIVEAAVSLGGKDVKEGITVVRFANRIPLLFEGGADVATRVAQSKIRWANYKIDMKRDRIGVFVSIVSTKIPFKGTGKEYIGDDITPIQQSVKRTLQSCCQQLRTHLTKKHAMKDSKERKSRLVKYVPDVSRALFGLLDGMRQRKLEVGKRKRGDVDEMEDGTKSKRIRLDDRDARDMIRMLDRKEITEDILKKRMIENIEAQSVNAEDAESSSHAVPGRKGPGGKRGGSSSDARPLFLVPIRKPLSSDHDIHHPLFVFRPLVPISMAASPATAEDS